MLFIYVKFIYSLNQKHFYSLMEIKITCGNICKLVCKPETFFGTIKIWSLYLE